MSSIDWDNAPEGAEYFNWYHVYFYKVDDEDVLFFDEQYEKWRVSIEFSPDGLKLHNGTVRRPQPKPPTIAQDASNKYSRQIVGLDGKTCQIDVYRVLAAFEVDSHPVAHAIKKLLAPGMRHAKTREQDLKEAIASIEAELLMMEQSK